MTLEMAELNRHLDRSVDWPEWVLAAPYVEASHPAATASGPIEAGANCQRYAYAVLDLFDRAVPPHRSSELWADTGLEHVAPGRSEALDLALFHRTREAWGAHVAVVLDRGLLHLCAEVGEPAIWSWGDFARRERYRELVGIVRVPVRSRGR